MKIRVLGCYGGSAPQMHPPCFLINGRLDIDAGAITSALDLKEQAEISHVFLTHSHIDHLVTLPFLLDNVLTCVRQPVLIFGPDETIHALKQHLFNDLLWPDFTTISNQETVILKMQPVMAGKTEKVRELKITPFPMAHTVQCYGYLLEEPDAAVAICSDTESINGLVEIIPKARNLKAVFLEVSFPARLAEIASLSKHLSTHSFAKEVGDIPEDITVLVSHLKPEYAEEIRREMDGFGLKNVSILEQGREYRF